MREALGVLTVVVVAVMASLFVALFKQNEDDRRAVQFLLNRVAYLQTQARGQECDTIKRLHPIEPQNRSDEFEAWSEL